MKKKCLQKFSASPDFAEAVEKIKKLCAQNLPAKTFFKQSAKICKIITYSLIEENFSQKSKEYEKFLALAGIKGEERVLLETFQFPKKAECPNQKTSNQNTSNFFPLLRIIANASREITSLDRETTIYYDL